jgi:uncharacterized membrane protein
LVDIRIIKEDELSDVLENDPQAVVFWVNRIEGLKPNPDTVRRYEDIKRRNADHPVRLAETAAHGSHYADNYRLTLGKSQLAQRELRNIAESVIESAKLNIPVYFIKENDRPDAEILKVYLSTLIGNGRYG